MLVLERPYLISHPLSFLMGVVRFLLFFIIVLLFIIHHQLVQLIIRNEDRRLRYFVKSVSLTTKLGLRLLNIKVDYQDSHSSTKAGLYVSNHLSYLDVLILFSKYPSLFITSKEIGNVFLLGHLTKLAGCFHIERRKHLRSEEVTARELSSMKDKLSKGLSLFLFPEGTSSNGATVLPFKAHFFQTALDLDLPIQPLCVKYEWGLAHPDEICWYGEMTFADHLFRLCCRHETNVTVTSLDFDYTKEQDRFQIAQTLHQKIKNHYEKH